MKKQFLTYQELNEALKLSQYRKYHGIRTKKMEKILSELFQGKDRIYIPFEYQVGKDEVPTNAAVKWYLSEEGYEVINYLEGYCEKDGRIFRIGKVLNQIKRQDLLKIFNEDPHRALQNKDFLICISKHPYDIAGMSTNRGWTSCMNLEDGKHKKHIKDEIKEGTIIAYLIDSKDRNINHPYGRINIKPYDNIYGEMAWNLAFYCYGSLLDDKQKPNGISLKFKETLDDFININLNKKEDGFYKIKKKVYAESKLEIYKGDKDSIKYKQYAWGINLYRYKDGVYDGNIYVPNDIKVFNGFEELFGFEMKEVKGHLSFSYCISLTSVSNLPENIKDFLSFYNCTSLTSVSNLPEKIGWNLSFNYCTSLTSIGKMPSVVQGSIYTENCPFFEGMNEEQIREKYNITK